MFPISQAAWSRFVRVVRGFFRSEVGWRATWLSALLVTLLFSVNGLNVVNSYVGRDFMTSISERQPREFIRLAIVYVGVFVGSTVVAIFYRFTEERLGLLWRDWLTRRLLANYLRDRVYLKLNASDEVDNPDQRIAEDVKTFTTTTLSFVILFLSGTITAAAFAGVLWSISPLLFLVSVSYAGFGTLMSIVLGRRLVGLNFRQLQKEANFRFALVHVRENTESIALVRGERSIRARLIARLEDLVENYRKIIIVNRNLGLFTELYKYLIQILPIVIVAPKYIRGEVEFGVVTQSAMAFAQILGAFSLIVTQFQQISTYAAVMSRLGSLGEAIDKALAAPPPPIAMIDDDRRLAFERLTLRSAGDDRVLVDDLTAEVAAGGGRLLVLGPDGLAKAALVRAIDGLWTSGSGAIRRPAEPSRILILPERPYAVPGSLRHQFVPPGSAADATPDVADVRIVEALRAVGIGPFLDRIGGLGIELDWANTLSFAEQQQLAIARLLVARPRFAVLDRVSGSLGVARAETLYRLLAATEITYLSVADQPDLLAFHDRVLELQEDGTWTLRPAREPDEGQDRRT